MPETETATREVQQLRRCIRDLVALSAFPAVWAGYDPRQIAESLADGLRHMLNLDLIYLAVTDRADRIGVEVARTPQGPAPADRVQEIRRVLDPWLKPDPAGLLSSIPDPHGNGVVPIVLNPFGSGESGGVLVAGSRRADFPTEVDRLLLGLGANQAALLLERRWAEEALRESEERFRGTFENAGVGIADCDVQGRFLRVNQKLCEIVGYTQLELLQKTWQEITHPDDRVASLEPFLPLVLGEQPGYSLEMRYVRKDGSLVWIDLAVSLRRDAAGTPASVIAILQDISERKRLEEELSQTHARLEMAVRGSNISIVEINMPDGVLETGRLKLISAESQLGGYDRSEVETDFATAMARVHPDDRERMDRALRAHLSGQTREYENEHRVRHKDGSYRWRLARGMAVRDVEGRAIRCVASTVDITDIKRAEEALRESERRFRTLSESLPQLIWTGRPDGSSDYLSRQWVEYTGVAEDEQLGDRWVEVLHPDDRDRTMACCRAAIEGRAPYDLEHRIRGADGNYRWFQTRGLPLRDESGRIVKWFGTCTDIDDKKRTEEALRESERGFRTLTEALPHMVWTAEPDGAPDYLNARNIEYTGLTPEQLRGGDWRSTLHPEDVPRCHELWTRSTATGELFEAEYRLRRADGAFRWHLARALALLDDSGRITKWFGSCIDIDDQKRAQEALREAKEAAEAANRAKDEFLANVSHEIRTPMNAILGMTELALDTPLTDDQRQCLKTVKSAADNLLGLINDLLDFSKIEAGKLELDPADFSLRAAVGDTLRALAVRAHRKGLELIYDVQPEVPDALVGDAGRLRQVLLNLVANAIKFTDAGEVVVRLEVDGEPAPEEVGVRFAVSDTGIGIPPDKQEMIFRAFEQEDTSTTRKYGGTGLGLSIAARLVALMGGAISVQSEPGRGSTFAFTARFRRQPHPTEPVAARPPVLLRDLRVLVVDDNPTNRHILEEWLRGWQMDPAAVGDGLAAMGALWDAASLGQPYALVLLDARMPDADGLALAARIRERAALAAIPIILLTSGDRPGDQARSRELRIDAHLLKPVLQDELLETIYRVMSRHRGDAPTAVAEPGREPAPVPVPAAAPLHILVAEDNELNAQLVEQLLARRGHRVRPANNGREALALVGEGVFDLLLLDVHMPELDGFEVVQAIRERERTVGGHLPVIALTARSKQEDRERCLAAGMDDFLTKPIGPAELFAAIDRVLAGRPASQAPLDSASEPGIVVAPKTLLAACDDDPVLLGKLIGVFRKNVPGSLARVQEAITQHDPAHLREAAHQLRGLVSMFSPEAAQAAARLEAMGADGELGDAASTFETLADLIERLGPLLENLPIGELRRRARRPQD